MRTVKFFTLGCKANQYDTQLLREMLRAAGFEEPRAAAKASLCIVNTCTVTAKADSESLNAIRRLARENPRATIVVTGCLAERDSSRIRQEAPAQIILKNREKAAIVKRLARAGTWSLPAQVRGTPRQCISDFSGRTRAFIKVQDGCDNYCSYCKVPLVRGRSRSRSVSDLFFEAESLAGKGFKEIVLTGICLGAYGHDCCPRIDLVDVIERLESINGIERIRLSSLEVRHVTPRLIRAVASSSKLCRHFHIPLQSADDEILRRMKRPYTGKEFVSRLRSIVRAIPDCALTTDVLVGFPGETDKAFERTATIVERIAPLKVHIFPYSRREGTSAALMGGEVDPRTVRERCMRLRVLAESASRRFRERFLATCRLVLVEGRSKSDPSLWEGFTDNYLRVAFSSREALANRLVPVCLQKIQGEHVRGRLV